MATVACPGCGLPRVESELEVKPCPVCDAAPVATAPRAKPKPKADPTDGLPSDVSELYAPGAAAPARASEDRSRGLFAAVVFVIGAFCGVGGVFGVQSLGRPEAEPDGPKIAARNDASEDAPERAPVVVPAVPQPVAVAPMPHEPDPKVAAAEPEPAPRPVPLPGHVETHEFNEPKDAYTVPVLKKGEHVVLKGKVKKLHVHSLDGGAVLDASGLEASTVTVTGKIDGGSKLKLSAPGGTVQFGSKIDGGSDVTVLAPGGEVQFNVTTTPTREGSKIDNGATVALTARVVEFKGDISGAGTKVAITLTGIAWLKIASVNGRAVVEYRPQVAGTSPPEVIVGPVAPGATLRKAE